MTLRRDDDRLAHIVEACEQAVEFTAGRSREDLEVLVLADLAT